LKDTAPLAEKGFSMLTASLKKKMDVQRAFEKKNAAAVERKRVADGGVAGAKVVSIATKAGRNANSTAAVRNSAVDGGSIEERSLRSTARLLRRSEAEKKLRRAVPVGMTRVAGSAKRAKIKSANTKSKAEKSGAAKKKVAKAAKKKTSGAKRRRA
jgi:hypothetical protein